MRLCRLRNALCLFHIRTLKLLCREYTVLCQIHLTPLVQPKVCFQFHCQAFLCRFQLARDCIRRTFVLLCRLMCCCSSQKHLKAKKFSGGLCQMPPTQHVFVLRLFLRRLCLCVPTGIFRCRFVRQIRYIPHLPFRHTAFSDRSFVKSHTCML